jgi:hypothetical protein
MSSQRSGAFPVSISGYDPRFDAVLPGPLVEVFALPDIRAGVFDIAEGHAVFVGEGVAWKQAAFLQLGACGGEQIFFEGFVAIPETAAPTTPP